MCKISFDDFYKVMLYEIKDSSVCIEIEFKVDNLAEYSESWMGKMKDSDNRDVYWYGLTSDGKQAYDFYSFEEFTEAKIFRGKSIQEIWNEIVIISIDATDPAEILPFFVN